MVGRTWVSEFGDQGVFLSLSLRNCVVFGKSLHPLGWGGVSVSSLLNGGSALLQVDKDKGSPSNASPTHTPKRNKSPHRKNTHTNVHSNIIPKWE